MVECYIDDIAVKSHNKSNHLHDLRIVFDNMRVHQLKMNPTNSFLGVLSGKFLGFIVTSKEFTWTLTRSMPSRTHVASEDP